MTLEVLCATMHQNDFSLIEKMNISGNAVFANQTDKNAYYEIEYDGNKAKMISTDTRGVGKNRNIALLHAAGDILLFADDDIRYNDNYAEGVLDAYSRFPDADMIVFSMDITKNGNTVRKVMGRDRRLRVFSALKYGTYVYSVRRDSLERANLWFSTMFGGGTEYLHGEDTLFILDALKRLKVYSSSFCLGKCAKDISTCFKGYDDKYFFDQGVLYAAAFSWLAFPMAVQFCIRKCKKFRAEMPLFSAIKNMIKGIRHFKNNLVHKC